MSKLKTLAAAAALLSGVSTSAMAQEATYWPADANRDGIMSEREWRDHHAPPPGQAQRLDAAPADAMSGNADRLGAMNYDDADTNRDGYVGRSEWDRYQARIDRMMENRADPPVEGEASYRAADRNRDGSVSREEWNQYRASKPMK
jgi:hypothetical protein